MKKPWAALQNNDDAYHPNEFCISDLSWRIFGLESYPHRFGQNPHLLKHDPLLCEISSCCAAKALVNCLCGHRGSTQTAWCSWDLVGQNCNKSLWLMPLWGFGKSSKGRTVDSTHSYKLTLILIDNKIQCHAIYININIFNMGLKKYKFPNA